MRRADRVNNPLQCGVGVLHQSTHTCAEGRGSAKEGVADSCPCAKGGGEGSGGRVGFRRDLERDSAGLRRVGKNILGSLKRPMNNFMAYQFLTCLGSVQCVFT